MEIDDQIRQLEFQLRFCLQFVNVNEQGKAVEKRYLVSSIDSVKIEIYPNEHPPPHFHIKSANINATFEILTCKILSGSVDSKTQRKIEYFHLKNKLALIEVWNKLRPTDCPVGKIITLETKI